MAHLFFSSEEFQCAKSQLPLGQGWVGFGVSGQPQLLFLGHWLLGECLAHTSPSIFFIVSFNAATCSCIPSTLLLISSVLAPTLSKSSFMAATSWASAFSS
ncbi:hypothetical protein ACQJBY_019558 [Aegilops geniculata]